MTFALPITDEAQKYGASLLRLHALISQGKCDADEADAIRDEMDGPWYGMTDEERARMRGLSEDLHSLAEHDTKQIPMSPTELAEWSQKYRQAMDTGRWDGALDALRHAPEVVPAEFIVFFRALAWECLGHPNVALAFLQEAARLSPAIGAVSFGVSGPPSVPTAHAFPAPVGTGP